MEMMAVIVPVEIFFISLYLRSDDALIIAIEKSSSTILVYSVVFCVYSVIIVVLRVYTIE